MSSLARPFLNAGAYEQPPGAPYGLLSEFAVISYTQNVMYLLFAATGSWIGAFCAVTWLKHEYGPTQSLLMDRAEGPGKSPPV
jgi:hypothetical protein